MQGKREQSDSIRRSESEDPSKITENLYEDLRRLAFAQLIKEYDSPKMDKDDLVHDAWLRLGGDHQPHWANRAQFISAAAETMRRILIERAKFRKALRHGGQFVRVELVNGVEGIPDPESLNRRIHLLITLHEAMDALTEAAPQSAKIVKLRYFIGLTIQEIAKAMSFSTRTVNRRLKFARDWLKREISKD